MPKKLCCCKEDVPSTKPHWVAVPCKEYLYHVYNRLPELQKLWPNVPQSQNILSGATYPWRVCGQDTICFDTSRDIFVMQRGGGGGGLGRGGNAAYIESIVPAFFNNYTFIPPGGSGPSSLDVRLNVGNFSGAMGYPTAGWGAGANGFGNASDLLEFIPTYIASGGAGSGVEITSIGGHGGIDEGIKGSGNFAGAGGNQSAGGTVIAAIPGAIFEAQPGVQYKGGKGKSPTALFPIVSYSESGGGGAAGFYGGGGGNFGDAGGGGSSKYQDGRIYLFPGTTFGPGSRCNPYFTFERDAGLGSNRTGRTIYDCDVIERCPGNGITFTTGESGADGETAVYFRNKWCTCTETQDTGEILPEPNYICLTEEQYDELIAQKPTEEKPPPSGENNIVLLSFVLNQERYLLLYECSVSCEDAYLFPGSPTDVKWYVQNVNTGWFSDNPSWTTDEITSCCDCYDCIPLCPTIKGFENPRPNNVRSCEYQNGSTCYIHLDSQSQWYYKCKPTNCWADFGIESIVKPYTNQAMSPNTTFDCSDDPCEQPPEKVWVASRCDFVNQTECCQTLCCGPETIEFCDAYLRSLITGFYPPELSTKCYFFKYADCIYVLDRSEIRPCDPTLSTNQLPINQGILYAIKNSAGLECCRPGILSEQTIQESSNDIGTFPPEEQQPIPLERPPYQNTPESWEQIQGNSCEDVVVNCYPFKDMFGTVIAPRVSSTGSYCAALFGVEYGVACLDTDAPVDDFVTTSVSMDQNVGLCYDKSGGNSVIQPLLILYGEANSCSAKYVQSSSGWIECPDCRQNVVCNCDCADQGGGGGGGGGLGQGGGPDCNPPCDSDPNFCDKADPEKTYSYETTYKLTVHNKGDDSTGYGPDGWFEANALAITFSFCEAQRAGYVITTQDQDEIDAIINFYSQKIEITSNVIKYETKIFGENQDCSVNTGWGPASAMCIKICDYTVKCFSGNAGHIAEKINGRLDTIVSATGLWPYFWFGHRQGCQDCGGGPNERPPHTLGDDLVLNGGFIDVAAFKVTIFLKGVSQRYYCCLSQRISAQDAIGGLGTQNESISTNTISPAEMASGGSFTMQQVSQNSETGVICGREGIEEVNLRPEINAFPYNDVFLLLPNGDFLLVKRGYESLCGGGLPQVGLKIYGLEGYPVFPCGYDPDVDPPYPVFCGDGTITSPCRTPCDLPKTVVCELQGGIITVT